MRALLVVAVAACGFDPQPIANDATLPGDPDAPIMAGGDASPWGPPKVIYDDGGGDYDPTLTADMLQLYFDDGIDIWTSTRTSTDQQFPNATLEMKLSTTSVERTPELSYDGLTIYLASTRNPGDGDANIWMATRSSPSDEWSEPSAVDPLSADHFDDVAAAPSENQLAIVLEYDGMRHVFESTRTSTGSDWGPPAMVGNVNSSAHDDNPMLSADQLELYFDSNRSGSDELYVASRASTADAFATPSPIATTFDTSSAPWISEDGKHLVFEHAGSFYEISR